MYVPLRTNHSAPYFSNVSYDTYSSRYVPHYLSSSVVGMYLYNVPWQLPAAAHYISLTILRTQRLKRENVPQSENVNTSGGNKNRKILLITMIDMMYVECETIEPSSRNRFLPVGSNVFHIGSNEVRLKYL